MRQMLLVIDHIRTRVLTREEHGQDLLEYGLLMALIAIVALAAVANVGRTINNVFWNVIANNF